MKTSVTLAAVVCVLFFVVSSYTSALAGTFADNSDDSHVNTLNDGDLPSLNDDFPTLEDEKNSTLQTPSEKIGEPKFSASTAESTPVDIDKALAELENGLLFENTTTEAAPEIAPSEGFGWAAFKIFGMLFVLLALMFLAIWLMKKYMPGVKEFSSNGIIQVLSRARITPTQSIYLVRVGEKGIVLAVSASEIKTLSEITNPDEMDLLAAQSSAIAKQSITQNFRDIFNAKQDTFDEQVNPHGQEEQVVEEMESELSEIRARISTWVDDEV